MPGTATAAAPSLVTVLQNPTIHAVWTTLRTGLGVLASHVDPGEFVRLTADCVASGTTAEGYLRVLAADDALFVDPTARKVGQTVLSQVAALIGHAPHEPVGKVK